LSDNNVSIPTRCLYKNYDLKISKCLRHFDALQNNIQELPEDGVDKFRNASELKSDWLTKKGKGKVHPGTGTEALYRPCGL